MGHHCSSAWHDCWRCNRKVRCKNNVLWERVRDVLLLTAIVLLIDATAQTGGGGGYFACVQCKNGGIIILVVELGFSFVRLKADKAEIKSEKAFAGR